MLGREARHERARVSRFFHAQVDLSGRPPIDCEFVHKVQFGGAARAVGWVEPGLVRVDLRDRQALNNGFGNALALAVEIVVTPLLFALGGWLIDRWLGTGPLFALAFGVFAAAGVAVRLYYQYRDDMAREEEGKPWTRSRQ
jgi:putative F0F1-ATPase subunit (Ca2+/Mg2+ transporter)